jgi:hypothetical protein
MAYNKEHEPAAVFIVVPLLSRQRHAEQPAVFTADAAQQQPPKQVSDAQSKRDAHISPGEYLWQEPVCIEHVEHVKNAEVVEQQKPPRHAPEKQSSLLLH